ncbi:MAG TPA: EAL domain-containing protein [Pseudomonas xinjiangensis]|uniref:EAL domain-containing protein n=2 Tax=root TaxID=1 RepID=A0A7V1BRF0_9GAMM|nr:EAL domain-containing protein [Halopseudomonas xinjiangensis]HEC46666.1 EAL domain-containing protein [Halopseudomonas xinjiangensis]
MSLVKQLILAICLFLLVAFSGSFVINLESSRNQLQEQLTSHAQDAATALGLSLAPHVNDQAMLQLLVSSMFDSSYFASIRIVEIDSGNPLVARNRGLQDKTVPQWFAELADIDTQHGSAILMNGWQQFARVEVVSHPGMALRNLWKSALGTLAWLVFCGLVSAALGAALLRRQLRPLSSVADQAEAITRRHYRTQEELPRTPELRQVVTAMNLMVVKLKAIFDGEAAETERYRRQAYHDALTELPNRLAFEHALAAALTPGENPGGFVLGVRLAHLNSINEQLGAGHADALLQALAVPLKASQVAHPGWMCCRVRGSEFLVLAPGGSEEELGELVEQFSSLAHSLEELSAAAGSEPLKLGIAGFEPGDTVAQVLTRIDQALAESTVNGDRIDAGFTAASSSPAQMHDKQEWARLLGAACRAQSFVLHFQPVLREADPTQVVHHKLLVRLPDADGQMMAAGHFVPWIERLGLTTEFDLCMLQMAFAHLKRSPARLALSITAQTIDSVESRQLLLDELKANVGQAALLTLEADARYVQGSEQAASFASELGRVGTRFGLQHFGGELDLVGDLALVGLDYLKIDSSYIRDVDQEPQKRLYLESLVRTAQRIDLPLIAEQVETAEEIAALKMLGIGLMQGHALAAPGPWPA